MPIKIEVEAASYEQLVADVAKVLGLAVKGRGILIDPELMPRNTEPNPAIVSESKPSSQDDIDGVNKARRGRPSTKNAPASGEQNNTGSATGAVSPASGAPVADAFAMPSAKTPAVEPATDTQALAAADPFATTPPALPAAAGTVHTIDTIKEKLKAVSSKPGGGLKAVIKILNDHGLVGANAQYVNLKPEQFESVAKAADAVLA